MTRLVRLGAALVALLATAPAIAQETLRLRMAAFPFGLHAGLFLAIENGYMKAGGIEIVTEDGTGSTATVNLIGTGQYDIGEAAVSAMATAREKGMPIKALATFIRGTDLGVLVPKESGWKTPKDLEGRKVVYTAGSLEGPFMESFFKAGNANMMKVEMLNVEFSSKIPTYLASKADALVTTVPFVLPLLVTKRPSNMIMFGDYGFNLPSIGYIAHENTIKAKPKQLQAFITALTRAWTEILDQGKIDEGVAAIVKHRPQAKLDTAIAKAQIEGYRKYFYTDSTKGRPLGWNGPDDWAGAVASMQKAGLIKAGAKPQDFSTNDFYPR